MKRKIQSGSFKYFFVKFFVDWSVKSSYKKYQVEGIENIPSDGSTIWASNHTNALMDPLVVLSATPGQKVYMARADIFKKKSALKWLEFLKIIPIYRIRDGLNSVKRNDEVIAQATDILLDNVPLVIYPEATHRPKHSLLKLSKGIFHIAYSVYDNSDKNRPVYILPIGLEYGDYFRFRSTVLVKFGKPIDVSAFIRANDDEPRPVQMQKLRALLTEKLAELITFIPDDDDYDVIWEYVKLKAAEKKTFFKTLKKVESSTGKKLKGLMRNLAVNKSLVDEVIGLREREPKKTGELLYKIERFCLWRIQNGISVYSISDEKGWGKILIKFFIMLAGLPYYMFSALASALIWVPTVILLSRIQDDAFYNSARFAARFALSPISFILWTVLYFTFLPWQFALACLLLSIPSLRYLYDYGSFARRVLSDLRWKFRKHKAPDYKDLF